MKVFLCLCVQTHDKQRAISSVSWPPADSTCVHMQQWTYRGTRSPPHGRSCKCLWGSSYRTRPHPPVWYTQHVHMVRDTNTPILTIIKWTRPNLAGGKRGEVLLRGWVVLNNSNREGVMRHQDKRMWVNLWCREDQMSSMMDGQTHKMHQKWLCQTKARWAVSLFWSL